MKQYFLIIPIAFVAVVVIVSYAIMNSYKDTIEISVINNDDSNVWNYDIDDNKVIEFVRKYQTEKSVQNNIKNIEKTERYIFKGNKNGETTIKLQCINKDTGEVIEEKVYKIKVDKNLKPVIIK